MFRVMSPQGYLQRPGLRAGVGEIIRPLASHIHILTSPRAWQAVNPDMSISLEQAGVRPVQNPPAADCQNQGSAVRLHLLLQGSNRRIGTLTGQRVELPADPRPFQTYAHVRIHRLPGPRRGEDVNMRAYSHLHLAAGLAGGES